MDLIRLSNYLLEQLLDNYKVSLKDNCLTIDISTHKNFDSGEFKVPWSGIVLDHLIPPDKFDLKENYFNYQGTAETTLRFVLQHALMNIEPEGYRY